MIPDPVYSLIYYEKASLFQRKDTGYVKCYSYNGSEGRENYNGTWLVPLQKLATVKVVRV